MAAPTRRAEPVRSPQPSASHLRATEELQQERTAQEARERRSMVRGLLILALLILILSIARAGLDRVFPHGWWHL